MSRPAKQSPYVRMMNLNVPALYRRPAFEAPDLQRLRPYQVEGVHWLRSQASALLSDEMRLGKTCQVLRALPRRARVIVVCPAIVRLVWKAEAWEWRRDLTAAVETKLRAPREGEIVIVSYDALPMPPRGFSHGLLQTPLTDVILVFDEAHFVKGFAAKRTERARLLAKQCGRVWGLTGTPLSGKPEDLFGVLTSCRLAERVFGKSPETSFARAFHAEKKGRCTVYGRPEPWVADKLREVMLRRTRAEVRPELPATQYQDILVAAPDDLTEFLNELDARWEEVGFGELPPFELISAGLAALARSKTDAAVAHVRSRLEDGPVVVFSKHKDPVLEMGAKLGAGVVVGESSDRERAQVIRDFQSGKLQCIALTIDAGGTGIRLDRADVCVFVDLDWTPGNNRQAADRLADLDKKKPIQIDTMVTDHPLDRRVCERLLEKTELIGEVVG
jgi:SWI/SNF-related matrix-associated actin-dependent regulator 1 of chromatin subfamily A